MPSSTTSSQAALDAAARKTVSCDVLEAAFAKNPHPDGKTMNALAERLKLNKKQVSNFFERERRKANIVIESRRKGGNGGGSSGNSSNGSVNGSAAKASSVQASKKATKVQASPRSASAPLKKPSQVTADKTFSPSSSASVALLHSALPNKRSTRGTVKKDAYYLAFGDDEDEEDAEGEDDNDDADGEEYRDDASAAGAAAAHEEIDMLAAAVEPVEEYQEEVILPVEVPQNPLVQKNKDEAFFNRAGGPASSRYASRNARYASRSPLYAFPAAQAPDNFRTAPVPPAIRRTTSASPSRASRSCSPLAAGTGRAQAQTGLLSAFGYASKTLAPPDMGSKYGSRASSLVDEETSAFGSLKRKRGALSESPTVMFLRNPFPAPLPASSHFSIRPEIARQASFQSMLEDDFVDGNYGDAAEFAAATRYDAMTLDAYQPVVRKRARVWFSKPTSEGEVADASQESIIIASSQESAKSRTGKPTADTAQPVNTEPRPSRTTAKKDSKGRSDVASEVDEEESSDDSDFGDDGGLKPKKKDNRPGAALRTNIACKELRQAFLSNPHPPADVLEALAARLGLGKKQVSNYFVRERKKAGFTIKVRHGLHRRRGPNKKKVDRPAVVVTQHDVDAPLGVNSTSRAANEADMIAMSGEEESDDGASDFGSHVDDMAIDQQSYGRHAESSTATRDDVPDLSYDEQDLGTSTRATFGGNTATSSLMAASKSMESMTTSSRQDEDEELASPPFEAVQLPPAKDSHKILPGMQTELLSFDAQVAPPHTFQYI